MSQRPLEEDIKKWHRWFGVEFNNEAWRLTELPSRTPEQTESMLHHAHAAALHWSTIGTADNTAKAWALLAQAHALAGNGAIATMYAQQNFDHLAKREAADWELAFAHIIVANAAHASGDHARHAAYYASAEALGNAIADPEDKAIFLQTFTTAPRP
ncbi:MAG: hypothetical protein JSS89_09275 [Bacteroidetes bacterium]|nr:hypothetical protein [Bacteroidota bacterium]